MGVLRGGVTDQKSIGGSTKVEYRREQTIELAQIVQ